MAPTERVLAAIALLLAAFWSAVFLAAAAGWQPGTAAGFGWMGTSGLAALVRILTYASLGLAGVLGVRAAIGWSSWLRRGVLAVVAVGMYYVARGTAGFRTTHGATATLTQALSNLGVVAALFLVVLPLATRWQRRLAVALVGFAAAVPVVNLALAGQLDHRWRALVDLRSDALWRLMLSLQTFFVLYLFWNLITWARLLTQWSAGAGKVVERTRTVLILVVVVKLVWDVAGLAGTLPSFLGGSSQAWVVSRHDGWASWVTAAVLAAMGAAWLWRRSGGAAPGGVGGGVGQSVGVGEGVGVAEGGEVGEGGESAAEAGARGGMGEGDGRESAAEVVVEAVEDAMEAAEAAAEAASTGTDEEAAGAPLPATEHLLIFAGLLAAPAVLAALLQMRPTANEVKSTTAQLVIAAAVVVAAIAGWTAAPGRRYRGWLALGAAALAAGAVYAARLTLAPNEVTGHYLLAPLAAFLLAAWIAWREGNNPSPTFRQRSLQVCAVAFCALLAGVAVFHVAPRFRQIPFPLDTNSVGAAGDQLSDPTAGAQQYRDVAPSWERWWHGAGGTFEPVTLDTAVTASVAVLMIASRRRRRRAPYGLATVLLASTIYAHSATLSPTAWAGPTWFYLAFAFPVVMTLAVDARELNAAHPARGRRLVGALGAILVLITVAGWSLLTRDLSPSVSLADRTFGFTRGLSLSFFLAAVVAAVVAGAVDSGADTVEREGQPGAGGIGVGQRLE